MHTRSKTGLPFATDSALAVAIATAISRAWRADDSLPHSPVDAHVRVGHERGQAPVRDERNGEADHAHHGPRLNSSRSVSLDIRSANGNAREAGERRGEGPTWLDTCNLRLVRAVVQNQHHAPTAREDPKKKNIQGVPVSYCTQKWGA